MAPNTVWLVAACCITASAHAQPEVLAQPQPEAAAVESPQTVAARTVVARAKALFAVGDYGAALAEFTRAYELLAGDPRRAAVLNNIAVCHERMFRYDLALQYYERYLHEATADAADRAEVEAVMSSLRDLLGTLRITGSPCGEIWVDNRKLGEIPVDVLVPAGAHVIEVRAKGYEAARRELRVTARTTQSLHFELEPLPTYRGLHSAYFWTGTGLTAAALITGSVLGIATLSERSDRQARADSGVAVDGQPIRDLALKGDIAFGTALVLGVGTTVLFFLTDWGAPAQVERPAQSSTLSVGIDGTRSSFSLALRGAIP